MTESGAECWLACGVEVMVVHDVNGDDERVMKWRRLGGKGIAYWLDYVNQGRNTRPGERKRIIH